MESEPSKISYYQKNKDRVREYNRLYFKQYYYKQKYNLLMQSYTQLNKPNLIIKRNVKVSF